jgi:hypothetical protein
MHACPCSYTAAAVRAHACMSFLLSLPYRTPTYRTTHPCNTPRPAQPLPPSYCSRRCSYSRHVEQPQGQAMAWSPGAYVRYTLPYSACSPPVPPVRRLLRWWVLSRGQAGGMKSGMCDGRHRFPLIRPSCPHPPVGPVLGMVSHG